MAQRPAGQAIVVPGLDALTASMLASAPPSEQKQMLGERLFPLIQRMHFDLAAQITGMLLEIDNSELLHMLESSESLKAKVEEAVAVLQAHQVKENAPASFQSMLGGPQMRPTRPAAAGATGAAAAGGHQPVRAANMNVRPITVQNITQPRPKRMTPSAAGMPGQRQPPQAPNMQQAARRGKKNSSQTAQQPAVQAIVIPGQDALTASMLASAPPQEQKQMLGERLFPLIQRLHPDIAAQITGMLLEIDNSELLHMLESSESLKAKVEEAVAVLQAHQAKENAALSFQSMQGGPQMRAANMNARPITVRNFTQPRPEGVTKSAAGMRGRPQPPQAPNMQQAARPGYKYPSQKAQQPAVQAIVVPGLDALTASMLASAPPQEQKQMLGERLFPLIQRMHPDIAAQITGMLLEIDNSELLYLLESSESLKAKVEEAVAVLQAYQAKENAASEAATAATNQRE